MPIEGAAAFLSQRRAELLASSESSRELVQTHMGAALVWARHRTTFRMSSTRSSASSLRYLGYVTTSMNREFEVGEGMIGRQFQQPGSLIRHDTEEAEAWAAPADYDRRVTARQIGTRYVYILHVTERCVVEFVGLAGAGPLETDDAAPLLLRFAADVVLAEPASEAIVIDSFDGAVLPAAPSSAPSTLPHREEDAELWRPPDDLPTPGVSRCSSSTLGSEFDSRIDQMRSRVRSHFHRFGHCI